MGEFIGYVIADTDRALFFQDHFWHEPDWMPKSQIQVSRSHDTQEVKVMATSWIMEKKELQEFTERLPEQNDEGSPATG